MERELKKDLMEIEHLIKDHEQRGNTHTQSVLQRTHEIIEPCAESAHTLSDLKKILERDTAKPARPISDRSLYAICLNCGQTIFKEHRFCPDCGQRLKRED